MNFKARIFVALVGISSVTSLIFGLVLYYFAQDRLVHVENTLLRQRSQTANSGAQDFLEGLRRRPGRAGPTPKIRPSRPRRITPMSSSRRSPIRRASKYFT